MLFGLWSSSAISVLNQVEISSFGVDANESGDTVEIHAIDIVSPSELYENLSTRRIRQIQ